MTEIFALFNKIVEQYGQTAALSTLIVTVIVYGVYLLLKNYSSLIKTYLENKLEDKNKEHATAALHRKNIAPKIRSELLDLAQEIKADRVLVFEFSNGSSNLVGLPFLYMTATYEVITPGTATVSTQYQRVNTAIVAEFLEVLESKGYFYTKNIDEIKEAFPVTYNLMKPNNTHSALFYSLYGLNDTIGFIVATTVKQHEFTRDDTLPRIAGTAQVVSSFLNFDSMHENL